MGLSVIKNLDGLMGGALLEEFGAEFDNILRNVYDTNTDPEKERSITITISLKPTKDRSAAVMKHKVTSKPAPRMPHVQIVMLDMNDAGEIIAMEKTAQIPGQQNMDGEEQAQPKLIVLGPSQNRKAE